jgi:tripartite-type tricarboxylate transporter receptor subunit TctC
MGAPFADARFASGQDLFYKSHTLTIASPAGAGSNYDLYVRTIARYLGKYIPGNPSVIAANVPGAGGMVLANQLANSSPRDGSFAGIIPGSAIEYELVSDPLVHFKSRELNWIGNMNRLTQTCLVGSQSGIKSAKDLLTKEVVVGATGVGADSYTLPIGYNLILGSKFKVVTGYGAAPDIVTAIEGGEVMGGCGIDVSQMQSQFGSSLRDGKLKFVMQAGLQSDDRFPDVPNVIDIAANPDQKKKLQVLLAAGRLGKPIAMPAEVPPERVNMVREAFDAGMKDPQFRADMQAAQLDTLWMTSAEVYASLSDLFSAPPASVEMLRGLLARK